jgi:hypothetical protein
MITNANFAQELHLLSEPILNAFEKKFINKNKEIPKTPNSENVTRLDELIQNVKKLKISPL